MSISIYRLRRPEILKLLHTHQKFEFNLIKVLFTQNPNLNRLGVAVIFQLRLAAWERNKIKRFIRQIFITGRKSLKYGGTCLIVIKKPARTSLTLDINKQLNAGLISAKFL